MEIRIEIHSDGEFNINSDANEAQRHGALFIVLKTRWKLTDYP